MYTITNIYRNNAGGYFSIRFSEPEFHINIANGDSPDAKWHLPVKVGLDILHALTGEDRADLAAALLASTDNGFTPYHRATVDPTPTDYEEKVVHYYNGFSEPESDPYAVDWDSAPYWAMFHAVDEDGRGSWFEQWPTQLDSEWYVDGYYYHKDFTNNPNWKSSLRTRPGAASE